jgi:prevent-host-death family protein
MGMANRYSIADARTSLSAIVDKAEAGEQVELTRRGQPVALVISIRDYERMRGGRRRFGEAYRAFLEKYSTRDTDAGAVFRQVRNKEPGRKVSL